MSSAGRTLVLCFDGTSNAFDSSNTNIIRLFDLLKKDEPDKMLCYYQPGIGTYNQPGMWMPLVIWLSKLADQAFAWFLDAHIMGGYKFLMQNWREGDRICLFGFSRGAYTARCLAGMLHKVGLIPMSNIEQVSFAYAMYKNSSTKGWDQSAAFARTFSRTVTIEFVGCFDTVSSVGVLYSRHLPFSSANTIIKTFRHALALDERRVRFQPNQWHRETDPSSSAKDPEHASCPKGIEERGYDTSQYFKTDVEEVWFTGCHSDIGGGAVSNSTPHSLAFVSLRWMIEQTIRTQSSILYKPGALQSIGLTTSPFIETHINTLDKYYSRQPGVVEASHDGELNPENDECTLRGIHEKKEAADKEEEHNKEEEKTTVAAAKDDLNVPSTSPPAQHNRVSHETEATFTQDPSTPRSTIRKLFTRRASSSSSSSKTHKRPTRDATNQVVVDGENNEERQRHDVLAPINDPLKKTPIWWLLEIIPEINSYQNEDGVWKRRVWIHLGRGRKIVSTEEPLLHVSVKQRMESGLNYKPKAKLLKGMENARWTE